MRKITDCKDLHNKRVIVRASLNIPLENGQIQNQFRLKRALPTLRFLLEQGAKVIIISHIGRKPEETLKPIFDELCKYFEGHWGGPITGEEFMSRVDLITPGTFLMAENLRQNPEEEENDIDFAKYIAQFGDIYVNDAFAEAHRGHASLSALATLLPAYAGLTLLDEVTHLEKVMVPEHPALLMIGGAKFETKLPLIAKYLDVYDHVFVGGALANDIFKALGYEVGLSLVSDTSIAGSNFLKSPKLLLPIDVVVDGPKGRRVCKPDEVDHCEHIFDCGPATTDMLDSYIEKAKTILWNGPFGNFEAGFKESTETTMRHLASSDTFSVVGGGDTVASIENLGLNDKIGFVSIGGGAMLTYLEEGSTPVLDLLK